MTFSACESVTGRSSHPRSTPEAQHDALTAAGCEQIFIDHASGKLARRPQLERALAVAGRSGDQLVVTKLDRLGRSLEHLIDLSNDLHTRSVDLIVLDQGIDTSTAVGRMFFQILGSIAEFEADLISQRTREGLAIARQKGRLKGKAPKLKLATEKHLVQLFHAGEHTVGEMADMFGISRATVYRAVQRSQARTR